jgi:hypothetical protein
MGSLMRQNTSIQASEKPGQKVALARVRNLEECDASLLSGPIHKALAPLLLQQLDASSTLMLCETDACRTRRKGVAREAPFFEADHVCPTINFAAASKKLEHETLTPSQQLSWSTTKIENEKKTRWLIARNAKGRTSKTAASQKSAAIISNHRRQISALNPWTGNMICAILSQGWKWVLGNQKNRSWNSAATARQLVFVVDDKARASDGGSLSRPPFGGGVSASAGKEEESSKSVDEA